MAGVQLSVILVFIFLCKTSLAQSSDIQKELEIIKGQLQIIVVENNDLKKRTNELELKVDLMTQENHDLKMKTNEQEHKLDMMTKENNVLKKMTNELEHKMDMMTRDNHDLKTKTNELDHKVDLMTLKKRTVVLDRKVKQSYTDRNQTNQRPNMYKNRSNYGASGIRRTRQTNGDGCRKNKRLLMPATTEGSVVNGTPIAFSAITKNVIANVGHRQEIPFETVETNIGQAFHAGTGTFSCPQNGVYAFFVTILAKPNIRMQVQIVREGVPVAFSYSHGNSNGYGSGSSSAVVRLQEGDKVWVREDYHYGTGDMIDAEYSSFMGFSIMLE